MYRAHGLYRAERRWIRFADPRLPTNALLHENAHTLCITGQPSESRTSGDQVERAHRGPQSQRRGAQAESTKEGLEPVVVGRRDVIVRPQKRRSALRQGSFGK